MHNGSMYDTTTLYFLMTKHVNDISQDLGKVVDSDKINKNFIVEKIQDNSYIFVMQSKSR